MTARAPRKSIDIQKVKLQRIVIPGELDENGT
jgi:hypothetical protein